MPPVIDYKKCCSCVTYEGFQCEMHCPGDIIQTDTAKKRPVVSYPEECWHCGNCRISCPVGAISYVFPASMLV
ncbi:MAG: 4Fe-4S binding protein [Chloroflexi bacterium]|nr:4Fe-4S binding protein [Chloroflexota bacterium]